jgi:hypothetical protein
MPRAISCRLSSSPAIPLATRSSSPSSLPSCGGVPPARLAGLEYQRAEVVPPEHPPAANGKVARYTAPLGGKAMISCMAWCPTSACSSARKAANRNTD